MRAAAHYRHRMAGHRSPDGDASIDEIIGGLDDDTLRRLLADAARTHGEVARAVRLAAATGDERLAVLRAAVDGGLRTRRYLDYRGSFEWARDASPVVAVLTDEVERSPTAELVILLQRAADRLVKVMLRADDSSGVIGDLCWQVLELHRRACEAGVADPVKLAKWMVKFTFADQDFFEIDPVAYVDAMGEKGLVVYRRQVAERSDPEDVPAGRSALLADHHAGFPSFEARYAAERLAIIDRDVDRLVELLGRDLSSPNQFQRVADAMVELGEPDEALAWARRGIAETSGWQVAGLYDLAAELLADVGDDDAILDLRRDHHQRMPSTSTYATLKQVASAAGAWAAEVDMARAVLAGHDVAGYVDALLADDEPDAAWITATTTERELMAPQWVRLADARESTIPADSMRVRLRLADEVLVKADKRAYREAIGHLRAASRAADAADLRAEFDEHLAGLRERNRRRPSFMAMLESTRFA